MSQDIQFQRDAEGRFGAIGYFADLEILLEADGHTTEEVELAMAQSVLGDPDGKQPGTVILILETSDALDERKPNVPGPQEVFDLTIRVMQRVRQTDLTPGAKDYHDIARFIKQATHQWQIGTAPVVYLGAEPYNNGKGIVGKDIRLTWGPACQRLGACMNPVISLAADGSASVRCNTPDANIFVTFDGSYPKPDPETELATGIESIEKAAPGAVVRAVAYAPGLLPSGITEVYYAPA